MSDFYKKLLFQSPAGYALREFIFDADNQPVNYVFLEVNAAYEQITGLKAADIVGRMVTDVFSTNPRMLDYEREWIKIYGNAVLAGKEVVVEQHSYLTRKYYRVHIYSQGTRRVATFFTDITREKRRIDELQTMFNGILDPVWIIDVTDKEYRFRWVNTAYELLTGITRDRIINRRPAEIFDKSLADWIVSNYCRVVREQAPFIYEHTFNFPSGCKMLHVALNPIIEHGKVRYIAGSGRDITMLKCIEAELALRLNYEKIVGEIARQGLRETDTSLFLNQALQMLGQGINVSRTYLFAFDWESGTLSNTHEWVAVGITPQIGNLQQISLEKAAWWVEELKAKNIICFADIGDIPDSVVKYFLAAQDIKAILVLPIYVAQKLAGFIGFDDCRTTRRWLEADINLLQVAAAIVGEYLTRKKYEDQIVYLSYHDQLTGLYNRRFLEEEMRRLDTSRQWPLSVILGDVNGLKLTNDVFGHDVGDKLLKAAADVITANCRADDIIARWGGDEFVILLPQTSTAQTEKLITRIKKAAQAVADLPIGLSIAFGCATKTAGNQEMVAVLKEAEDFMYRRKLLENQSTRSAIIASLKATLWEKSLETEAHTERIKELSLLIADRIGLSAKDKENLALAALLHDIGKVAIPEPILKKPGPLNAQEWEEMKKHSEIGYRIVQTIPELAAIGEYILYHHEHWDGKGYPAGIAGEEIPLLARIIAVADAYDAMTNDRVYRRAMSRKDALQGIAAGAGRQFDPAIVTVFLNIMQGESRTY